MAQLQASCSCSCFLKSISHLLPFAGRSESRTAAPWAPQEVIRTEGSRNTPLVMRAAFCPPEPILNSASQDENHWLCLSWGAHTCLPSCPTLVCPLTTVRMLSSNFLEKKNKPIMSNPFSISLIRANSGNSESYRRDWKTKSCCYQPNQTPISSSLLLSVGHQYLTQFEIPVAKIKTHYLT